MTSSGETKVFNYKVHFKDGSEYSDETYTDCQTEEELRENFEYTMDMDKIDFISIWQD